MQTMPARNNSQIPAPTHRREVCTALSALKARGYKVTIASDGVDSFDATQMSEEGLAALVEDTGTATIRLKHQDGRRCLLFFIAGNGPGEALANASYTPAAEADVDAAFGAISALEL